MVHHVCLQEKFQRQRFKNALPYNSMYMEVHIENAHYLLTLVDKSGSYKRDWNPTHFFFCPLFQFLGLLSSHGAVNAVFPLFRLFVVFLAGR